MSYNPYPMHKPEKAPTRVVAPPAALTLIENHEFKLIPGRGQGVKHPTVTKNRDVELMQLLHPKVNFDEFSKEEINELITYLERYDIHLAVRNAVKYKIAATKARYRSHPDMFGVKPKQFISAAEEIPLEESLGLVDEPVPFTDDQEYQATDCEYEFVERPLEELDN